jgi:hypothetical protein
MKKAIGILNNWDKQGYLGKALHDCMGCPKLEIGIHQG